MSNLAYVQSVYLHPDLHKKRDAISSIFIRHDDILAGWEVLERTYHLGFRVNEASTGYIYGHSRCGKTELVHRFIKHLTGKRPKRGPVCQFVEGNGARIIYLDLTNASGPLAATMSLLRIFQDVKASSRITQAEATERLIGHLLQYPVDLLIVDEAQQAFKGGGAFAVQAVGDWLLPLENARACKLVLVGSPQLRSLFDVVEAAHQRHGGIAILRPFSFQTEIQKAMYEKFLEKFAQNLPFKTTCILDKHGTVSERCAFNFYFANRGVPGGTPRFSEEATYSAFKRAGGAVPETLEESDFASAFDFLYGSDERMKGINPFRVSNRKLIPAIPLTPEENDQDYPSSTNVSIGRRSGGRINA